MSTDGAGARSVDLVADIGESFGAHRMGDDDRILRSLTSANIACGFHAGDPRTMEAAVESCGRYGVAIGAHPSFPDLVGFGRRAMELSRDEVRTDVLYQIGALQAIARAHGTRVTHLSPHGRLGSLVATEETYAGGVADAVEQLGGELTILTMAGRLADTARERGLSVTVYGLVDRNVEDDGTQVSRRDPEALVHDPDLLVERAVSMVLDGVVLSRSGVKVAVDVESLLLHGDNLASIEAAERVRAALVAAGVTIAPFRPPGT